MRHEQTSGELWDFGERLFRVIRDLSGKPPELLPDGASYCAAADGIPFVRLRLIGANAGSFPQDSAQLAAQWNDWFREEDDEVTKGQNWHQGESADLIARVNDPNGFFRAQRFIFQAFALNGGVNEEFVVEIARQTGQTGPVVKSILNALPKAAAEFLARPGRQAIKIPGLLTIEAWGRPGTMARAGIDTVTRALVEIPGRPANTAFRAWFAQQLRNTVGVKDVPETPDAGKKGTS
jgi:hypothetical protein